MSREDEARYARALAAVTCFTRGKYDDATTERMLDALTEHIGATVEAGIIARLRLKLTDCGVQGPARYALEKLLESDQ